jgi:hypothetical protein
MSSTDFLRLIRQQAEAPPTVRSPLGTTGIGLGPDASEYETTVAPADSAAVARQIVKAAKTRAAGGPLAPQMSAAAQAIIDAGVRRRGG